MTGRGPTPRHPWGGYSFPPPRGCDAQCMEAISLGRLNPGVLDEVRVPANLAPGRYVLGWRWDCDASAQVWSSCADITLVR